jgi:rubredoxin
LADLNVHSCVVCDHGYHMLDGGDADKRRGLDPANKKRLPERSQTSVCRVYSLRNGSAVHPLFDSPKEPPIEARRHPGGSDPDYHSFLCEYSTPTSDLQSV